MITVSEALVKSQKIPQTDDLLLICDKIWFVKLNKANSVELLFLNPY
jgi:hypothetical protein